MLWLHVKESAHLYGTRAIYCKCSANAKPCLGMLFCFECCVLFAWLHGSFLCKLSLVAFRRMHLISTGIRSAPFPASAVAAWHVQMRVIRGAAWRVASGDGQSALPGADTAANGTAAGSTAAAAAAEPQFTILSETVQHKRYLTLYNREVQFPSSDGQSQGPIHSYDIIGHPQCSFHFAVVFPWHPGPDGGSVTLIREYAQGVNQLVWCLPTGGFDPQKHASWQGCAQAELSEEAQLTGGTWLPLIEEGHPGIAEVKWCRNRFHSYVCIDPQPDPDPGARDEEEYIQVVRVSLPELRRLMVGGDMLLPSVATCFLALEVLQQQGHLGVGWQQAAAATAADGG